MVGEDAYEGLTTYAVMDFRAKPFVAAIFPGEMPESPEEPAATE